MVLKTLRTPIQISNWQIPLIHITLSCDEKHYQVRLFNMLNCKHLQHYPMCTLDLPSSKPPITPCFRVSALIHVYIYSDTKANKQHNTTVVLDGKLDCQMTSIKILADCMTGLNVKYDPEVTIWRTQCRLVSSIESEQHKLYWLYSSAGEPRMQIQLFSGKVNIQLMDL